MKELISSLTFSGFASLEELEKKKAQLDALATIINDDGLRATFQAASAQLSAEIDEFDGDYNIVSFVGTEEEKRLQAVAYFKSYFNSVVWNGATVRKGIEPGTFLIEAGSELHNVKPSCPQNIVKARNKLQNSGQIANNKLLSDYIVSSLTAAAEFIVGYAVNGNKTPLSRLL